jgi:hypothetical protein
MAMVHAKIDHMGTAHYNAKSLGSIEIRQRRAINPPSCTKVPTPSRILM